ncbi:MAG: sugar phosphate nucleotidyltransferase [Streptosporangiaceae bacterium]
MIGMVLAAGTGRRLRPDTDGLPKALLPVAGETTILDIALRNLAAAGLAEVVIVVGYAAGMVADRVPALEKTYGISIDLVHNERAEEWNNAYSLWLAREYFGRGVMLVNGDTVHPVSVEKTLLAASAGGQAAIAARLTRKDAEKFGAATRPGEIREASRTSNGARREPLLGRLIIAIDDLKALAEEEMKVELDPGGMLVQITKVMDPAHAHGEYMGVTLIEPAAAVALADCLETTWRRNPHLYYEDGFAEFSERGGAVLAAPIGAVEWVEVDDHADLLRAREIATRC